MESFVKQGIKEYRRRNAAAVEFTNHSRRIRALFSGTKVKFSVSALPFLTPLIQIAWIDGRVGRFEQDAIMQTADIYGLLDSDEFCREILERLSTRPTKSALDRWWNDVFDLSLLLPVEKCSVFTSLLLRQTRFVADLGQKHQFGLWRGYKCGNDEEELFAETEKRLSKLNSAADELSTELEKHRSNSNIGDILKLMPLVKVAWADGRITKRERQLIFESLVELGIDPSDTNLKVMANWLKLSPQDAFFRESIEKLTENMLAMNRETRMDEKYSLLSRCTLIAEASGGNKRFHGGGANICDEEKHAVMEIAQILNRALSLASK